MSEPNKAQLAGCLLGVIKILVTTPLYYIFLYQVLIHIQATDTIWILFWIYMPVSIGFLMLMGIISVLAKKEND